VPQRMIMHIESKALCETPKGDRNRLWSETVAVLASADEGIDGLPDSEPEQLLCLSGSPSPQFIDRVLPQGDDAHLPGFRCSGDYLAADLFRCDRECDRAS